MSPAALPELLTALPWFTDSEVAAAVPMAAAVVALRKTLLAAHEGWALPIPKTMTQWADGDAVSSAHALGAIDVVSHRVAFKYWVNTPRGAQALLTLFDARQGQALAAMDAGMLGMLRTSGTAALATDVLAAPDADRLALLGAGRQAMHQVRAVAEVRRLREVRVWCRDPARRQDFADRVAAELDLPTAACDSVEDAVHDAPIVTTVTRARDPFLPREALTDGAHVNAVGAILPTHRELLPGVVEAAELVVVDDRENCRRAAAELRDAGVDFDRVATLGALLSGDVVRPAGALLTVFKTVGTGLGDLAIAGAVHAHLEEG